MGHHQDVLNEMREPTRSLRKAIPEQWSGFVALHGAALGEGAVTPALKEAAALAISVVKRCDGCIAHHARAAVRAGATPEEVAEMLGVALLMDGAVASVYGPRAWEAFLEMGGGAGDSAAPTS